MKKLFFLAAMILLSCQLFAQIPAGRQTRPAAAPLPPPLISREVSGKVIDATGQGVPGVNMILSSKSDTIKIATNADGVFVFHDVKQATYNINATSVGFLPFVGHFAMNDVAKRIVMDPITLKDESKQLTQVNINGTPSITYKTDTVEYRASDYKVRENSTVDELLKHMEGFEVGSDGSVTHQGQAVTKARLNGKDYAGGNLAQAIQSLPADIVEKIQVVDDYGDQAARTGIKDGDPTKVLNITTLANKSIGNIGRATVMEGTNDRYQGVLFYNRINANQVIVLNASTNNAVTGVSGSGAGSGNGNAQNSNSGTAGITTRSQINTSYRDQVSKTTQINASYTYGNNYNFAVNNANGLNNTAITDPVTKQITGYGTTIDTTNSVTRNNTYSHNATMDYEWQPDSQNYVRIRPTYSYSNSMGSTYSSANYYGYQNQGTTNHNTTTSITPTFNLNATYQYLFKHDKRQNISIQYAYSNSDATNTSTTDQHILYRDNNGVQQKDSLVSRYSNITNKAINNTVTLQYAQPLSKIGAPVTQYLEFNESYSDRSTDYTKVQSNSNPAGVLTRIDSLSNIYNFSFAQGNFAVQYRRNGAKSQLTLGARVILADLTGHNISKNTSTNHNDFYVIPVLRYQYQWSRTEQISVNYTGTPQEPTFQEIQPVPDYSNNPQNPIFGNPNLKPSFNHSITTRFNDYIANSKFNFSLNSTTTYTQDQIVQNNIAITQLLPVVNKTTGVTTYVPNRITDTYYLNTDGGIAETVTHNIAKQLNDRAYNLELNGTVSYNYNPIYNGGERFHQAIWLVNERFGPRINPNTTFEINPYVSYQIQRSFSTLPSTSVTVPNSSDIRTTIIDLQGRIFLGKERRFTFQYDISKNYVNGIQSYTASPLVANAYINYEFFARKNGTLQFSAFDIFKQNVFVNHAITTTGYTNTISNTQSRYFTLSFILNLSKFSGTPMRNGVQQRRRGDGSFIVD